MMYYLIIFLLIGTLFYLFLKKCLIEKTNFSNQNLDLYYKDIVHPLYKTNDNDLTFKDTKNCNCGYLKIGYSDIAERYPDSYTCPDLDEKKLLKETLLDRENNYGWRNIL